MAIATREHAFAGPVRQGQDRYEMLLRSIGAMLDSDRAGRITIVELDDGFAVRRQRFRHTDAELAFTHLTHEVLQQYALELRLTRPRVPSVQHPGLWGAFAHTHQDFFRALGHELDAVGAQQVMIDELSDGLLVHYEEATHTGAVAARRLLMTKREIEQLLNEAVVRRQVAGEGTISQRLGAGLQPTGRPSTAPRAAVWTSVRDEIPYQRVLRAVGSVLDDRGAERVCVVETSDGVAIRYCTARDARPRWMRLTDDELAADGSEMRQKSGLLRRRKGTAPGRYQDFFRGLGYELEGEYASGILLHEHDGAFTVSYEYPDPDRSPMPQRAMIVLGPTEQNEIVQQGWARRKLQSRLVTRILRRRRG